MVFPSAEDMDDYRYREGGGTEMLRNRGTRPRYGFCVQEKELISKGLRHAAASM